MREGDLSVLSPTEKVKGAELTGGAKGIQPDAIGSAGDCRASVPGGEAPLWVKAKGARRQVNHSKAQDRRRYRDSINFTRVLNT